MCFLESTKRVNRFVPPSSNPSREKGRTEVYKRGSPTEVLPRIFRPLVGQPIPSSPGWSRHLSPGILRSRTEDGWRERLGPRRVMEESLPATGAEGRRTRRGGGVRERSPFQTGVHPASALFVGNRSSVRVGAPRISLPDSRPTNGGTTAVVEEVGKTESCSELRIPDPKVQKLCLGISYTQPNNILQRPERHPHFYPSLTTCLSDLGITGPLYLV